jgi:hypothetical protein
MSLRRAVQIILGISTFGLIFSGVLSYHEVFGRMAGGTCPAPGAPGTVFGYPACVYGFFMYLAIVGFSAAGLASTRRKSVERVDVEVTDR